MSQNFIARIVNHVANEIIIKGLSNSRTFQKFAVRTNQQKEQLQKHGTEHITKTLEEILQKSSGGSGDPANTVSGAAAAAATKTTTALQPPSRPLRGIPGFLVAFGKEVKKDFASW